MTESVSFSCWLHNFQYSHPYRSTDRLSPPLFPPHPEQRTNQHHVVIVPRKSSTEFGEAKMFFFCISIDRTTKWSLQDEIIVIFLCLLSGLHPFLWLGFNNCWSVEEPITVRIPAAAPGLCSLCRRELPVLYHCRRLFGMFSSEAAVSNTVACFHLQCWVR